MGFLKSRGGIIESKLVKLSGDLLCSGLEIVLIFPAQGTQSKLNAAHVPSFRNAMATGYPAASKPWNVQTS